MNACNLWFMECRLWSSKLCVTCEIGEKTEHKTVTLRPKVGQNSIPNAKSSKKKYLAVQIHLDRQFHL